MEVLAKTGHKNSKCKCYSNSHVVHSYILIAVSIQDVKKWSLLSSKCSTKQKLQHRQSLPNPFVGKSVINQKPSLMPSITPFPLLQYHLEVPPDKCTFGMNLAITNITVFLFENKDNWPKTKKQLIYTVVQMLQE